MSRVMRRLSSWDDDDGTGVGFGDADGMVMWWPGPDHVVIGAGDDAMRLHAEEAAWLAVCLQRALETREGTRMAEKLHCDHCDAVIPAGGDYYQLRVARRIVGTIWEPLVTERDLCPACLAIVAPGAGLEKEEGDRHGGE